MQYWRTWNFTFRVGEGSNKKQCILYFCLVSNILLINYNRSTTIKDEGFVRRGVEGIRNGTANWKIRAFPSAATFSRFGFCVVLTKTSVICLRGNKSVLLMSSNTYFEIYGYFNKLLKSIDNHLEWSALLESIIMRFPHWVIASSLGYLLYPLYSELCSIKTQK